jgi:2,4-dienoyl-CoA reductase-like NADH-dependent reductase (Old Yellow Enzyme family)
VRISATDWADGGWNAEESVQLSKILKEKGFDGCLFGRSGISPKKYLWDLIISSLCRTNKITSRYYDRSSWFDHRSKTSEEIVASGKADMVLFLENHCVI